MHITKKIYLVFLTAVFVVNNLMAQIYIAPDGNDSNTGKINSPLATLTKAVSLAAADTLIYMRGGVYNFNATIKLSKSGSEGHTIKVWNYPGEHPIIDFKQQPISTSSRGIYISGKYWHVKGLEIRRAGDNGIYITGSYNLVEACRMHNNFDSGLQISGGGSYNKVINCDSYANYDSLSHGENADGFAAKLDIGPGNEFHGCRSWYNVDDGWDLYEGQNPVVIDSCWTFQNGFNLWNDTNFQGDGNGFKLGGNNIVGLHIVTNCVAFDNKVKGFDQNNNMGAVTIYNCTSWRNKSYNYSFPKVPTTGKHILKNNLGFGGSNSISSSGAEQEKNSWNGFTVSESDFINLDTILAKAPRNADSSLPEIDFLKLVSTSSLVDAGVDVGLKYNGIAPDLGAFETGTASGVVDKEILIKHFSLEQNYPNPFNPVTTIRFTVDKSGFVNMSIFNSLGELVETLVNEEKNPGAYSIEFSAQNINGSSLPSGIYFAKMQMANNCAVKKLVLLK